MSKKNAALTPKLGDLVKIRHSLWRGRVVELRGPLGPGGAHVYRVRVQRKPAPRYVEVLADQLEPIRAKKDAQGRG